MRTCVLWIWVSVSACVSIESKPGDEPIEPSTTAASSSTSVLPEQTPPTTDVVINEVMPGNQSTVTGPHGVDRPDWVELLNTGSAPASLAGLTLRTSDDEVQVVADGDLDPGERLLVFAEEGFTLDKDGDTLELLVDGVVAEEVTFAEVGSDVALARVPDGVGELSATAWPTPGEDNGDTLSPTLDPANETWFTTRTLHEIRFTFTPEARSDIDRYSRPEVHVAMDVDGVVYPDIALKLKGGASYDNMNGKPAFSADLNQWVQGEKLRGLKAFNLHNGLVLDPTRTRDHLTYAVAREAGLMAPRVGWAQVWVDGEDYGLYIVVESHDDQMIAAFSPASEQTGIMLEPNEDRQGQWLGGDFGMSQGGPVPTSDPSEWDQEEGPVPMPAEAITSLDTVDRLLKGPATDAAVEELWTVADKDGLLAYLAWERVTAHTDGYTVINNWRVYVDGVDHEVHWVPSGAEWTWDNWAGLTWQFGSGKAGVWCLGNAGCHRDYHEAVLEVADLADGLLLDQQFQELTGWLQPLIDADPRYPKTAAVVAGAQEDTLHNLVAFPERARQAVYDEYPDLAP